MRLLSLLLVGLIYSLAGLAYNVANMLRPQGPLGIALDYSMVSDVPQAVTDNTVIRPVLYSSHLHMKNPVSEITDAQLWQLAFDAYAELGVDATQYGWPVALRNRWPNAMSVLAWDNELILSSSLKGSSYTYEFTNSPVKESLDICQAAWTSMGPANGNPEHHTEGKCGEPLAVHQYYMMDTIPLRDRHARIGTIVWNPVAQQMQQRDPCGDQNARIVSQRRDPPQHAEE